MHPLLDKYLCEKYPKIFSERNLPASKSCMHWGICVGNGWFYLMDNLCRKIQNHIDIDHCEQFVAKQVKEKFSGLRFYYDGGDDYIQTLVDEAEDSSYSICEECGIMDETVGRNNQGWIRTTCERHTKDKSSFKRGKIAWNYFDDDGNVRTDNTEKELQEIWQQVRKDEEEKRKEYNDGLKKLQENSNN